MEILNYSDATFAARFRELLARPRFDPEVEAAAAAILAAVRTRGDAALVELARQFDQVELAPGGFAVPPAVIAAAAAKLSAEQKEAIAGAHAQLAEFARQQLRSGWEFSPREGVRLGERFVPLDRVGCYVPGGTAPLVSTVLHTVTLAKAAGVKEIVVTTPGNPHPAILHAAQLAGATEVLRLGGVYAIGALAYGTASVRKVEKVVGPGNAYVTAAKRLVYGEVALDLVAGPSEILILADGTAEARFVAADMLSQAEHGSGREQAWLVTTEAGLVPAVQAELERQTRLLGRAECVRRVLEKGVFMVVVPDLATAAALASELAPEHLEIMTREPRAVAARITAAGALFLGPWTPEPAGDFVAGPSHVLPTAGAGRFFSGLTVEQFYRRMSVVEYSREALRREAPWIRLFAAMEGLDAHGRSAAVRFD
ncbi:MAG: histidinol dehydrogenase [Lentisphaeria bacterium]|jgi:histidinol dehydrogenase